jgi:hypothetical protein
MKKTIGIMFTILIVLSITACSSSEIPTDEEVNSAYKRAEEAYGWFDLAIMPVDEFNPVDYNGKVYYKVVHESIHSLADLEAYLHSIFSGSIVDSLLKDSDYVEIDGVLHTMMSDRGSNIYVGDEYHKIIHEDEKRIIYQVTVDIFDDGLENVVDQKEYSFPYEFIEDKWVFTNFSLVR